MWIICRRHFNEFSIDQLILSVPCAVPTLQLQDIVYGIESFLDFHVAILSNFTYNDFNSWTETVRKLATITELSVTKQSRGLSAE